MIGSNMPTEADRTSLESACKQAVAKLKALKEELSRLENGFKTKEKELSGVTSKCRTFTREATLVLNECMAVNVCQRAHLQDRKRDIVATIERLQVRYCDSHNL
jgi:hypothetical protein